MQALGCGGERKDRFETGDRRQHQKRQVDAAQPSLAHKRYHDNQHRPNAQIHEDAPRSLSQPPNVSTDCLQSHELPVQCLHALRLLFFETIGQQITYALNTINKCHLEVRPDGDDALLQSASQQVHHQRNAHSRQQVESQQDDCEGAIVRAQHEPHNEADDGCYEYRSN